MKNFLINVESENLEKQFHIFQTFRASFHNFLKPIFYLLKTLLKPLLKSKYILAESVEPSQVMRLSTGFNLDLYRLSIDNH